MRISTEQRQQNEARIRTAIDRLLAGDILPGGKCDIKTLAREAAVDRAAFYGTRPYAHLREEFETRLKACVLTCRVTSGGLLEDGVPGCGGAGAAFGPSGSGFGGFWRPGWRAGKRGQASEIPADPAGAQFSLRAAAFPALAVVFGCWPGEAELGEGGDDQPGPAGDLLRVAQRRLVPAQGVLGEPVGVLGVETGGGRPAR